MKKQEIFKAIFNADLAKVEKLISEGVSFEVYSDDSLGESALQFAISEDAEENDLAIVKAIIDSGVAINGWSSSKKNNPILTASSFNNPQVVKLLLEHGADPVVENDEGESPLRIFVGRGDIEMVKELIAYGADKGIHAAGGMNGMNALGIAVSNGNIEMIKLLLAAGADSNRTDLVYMTAVQRMHRYFSDDLKNEIRQLLS